MKVHWLVLIPLSLLPAASAAVTVDDVVNAGSWIPSGVPGSGIARGAVFAVSGSGLGPDQPVHAQPGFPLPAAGLAGVSVQMTVQGITVDAIPIYASAHVLLAILPSATPAGAGTMAINNNGDVATVPVTVVESAFGIFTNGTQTLGFNVNPDDGSKTLNQMSQPASAGQNIILNGTGLGAIASDETQGGVTDIPQDVAAPVVYVGGVQATVVSYGRGDCCDGMDPDFSIPRGIAAWDTITFTVPHGVAGCAVPVLIKTGGTLSNTGTLAIASASGAPCSDRNFPSTSAETLNIASIGLIRNNLWITGLNYATDSGSASFYGIENRGDLPAARLPSFLFASLGSCTVSRSRAPSLSRPAPTSRAAVASYAVDAGGGLNLSGPNADAKSMPSFASGVYSGQFDAWFNAIPRPHFLDAGPFQIDNGAGGNGVGPYQISFTNPPPFSWDYNYLIKSIVRSDGLTVTWTPPSDTASTYISIEGTNWVKASGGIRLYTSFACTADASLGTFTIPAEITSVLLPYPVDNANYASGQLAVSAIWSTPVVIPGIDLAFVTSRSGTTKLLSIE